MSCPICHKPTASAFRPFCSRHCADVDLGRWFKGNYRTPSFRLDDDPADSAKLEGEINQSGHIFSPKEG